MNKALLASWYDDELRCPHCGHVDGTDSYDYRHTQVNKKTCESCSKDFAVEIKIRCYLTYPWGVDPDVYFYGEK